MMDKQPPSLAAATRLAAQAGGSIDLGGRVINPSGARMPIARPYLAQPAQEPARDGRIDAVVEMMRAQSQVLAAQLAVLPEMVGKLAEAIASSAGRGNGQQQAAAQASAVAVEPPKRPVRFVIDRDEDGDPVSMSVEYGPGSPTRKPSLYAMKGADGLVHEVNAEY